MQPGPNEPMQISHRVTNGLAWTGLLLVVGVPSADFLSAQLVGEAGGRAMLAQPLVIEAVPGDAPVVVPAVVVPAAVVPAESVATVPDDPVAAYLVSGRDLPDYISGGEASVVAETPVSVPAPSVANPEPAAAAPVPPVAAVAVENVAPVPMPLAMRPVPVEALFIPESVLAPVQSVEPGRVVGSAELAEWRSGTLADFLAARAVSGSSASYDPAYDPGAVLPDNGGGGSSAVFRREPSPIIGVWPLR